MSRQFSLGDVEPEDDNEEAIEEDAEGEEDVDDDDDEPRGLFRSTLGQSKGGELKLVNDARINIIIII